jgi:hypothetical protein
VRGGSIISISDVPCLGSTFITRRWFDELLSWLKPKSTIPAVLPRLNVEDQILKGWSPEEDELFMEPPEPGPESKGKKKSAPSAGPKKPKTPPYLPNASRRRPKDLPPDF